MTRRAPARRAVRKSFRIVISAFALFAGLLSGCTHLRAESDLLSLAPHDEELAVLTYNVFGFPLFERWQRPGRFGVITDELRSALGHVDVVLLQEAFTPSTRVLRKARRHAVDGACGSRAAFNPTGLLLLSDHKPVGEATSFAFLRDDDGRWRMKPERVLDCDSLAARNRPLKGMMALTLSTPRGLVDVINLHLDLNPKARRAQKRLIARFLDERESARPLILAGDLNEDSCRTGRGNPFSGSLSLEGASCGVGPTVGGLRLGMFQGTLLPAEIDSVYVCGAAPTGKRARVFSSPRAGGHLSDHDGVLTFVRLDPSNAIEACSALSADSAKGVR